MNQTAPSPEPKRSIRFGVFEVDLRAGELRKNGLKIKLQEQPFQILSLLLERAGEVVPREELRQKLWSADTFVDFDHGLNAAVKRLRQALGDSADNPRFVETLARRGYRFIAPMNHLLDDVEDKVTNPGIATQADSSGPVVAREPGARFRRSVVATVVLTVAIAAFGLYWLARREKDSVRPINSLAILPFTNASGDPDAEYLSDGITESLINRFSRLRQLRVVPRTTVFRYKRQEVNVRDLGRKLNVDAVLTGRVLQRGDILNVQAELVNVIDGSQLWGEQYQSELGSLIEVPEEISRVISERLRLQLTGDERNGLTKRYTHDNEAYQLYLKGLYFWNKRTESAVQKAIDYFEEAVEKDPNYALAYAMLSDCHGVLQFHENRAPRESFPRIKAAAIRALSIDDTLAEGHMRLAFVKLHAEWDWKGAEWELRRAIELNPGLAAAHQRYSLCLMATGRTEESLTEIRRALQLDPVSLIINTSVGSLLYLARRYDEAIDQCRKTLEMDPNFANAHLDLGHVYAKTGRYQEALAAFDQARAMSKVVVTAMQGYVFAVMGQRDEARKLLNELLQESKIRYVSPYYIATIYTGLGDKDQALTWLQKACDDCASRVVLLAVDPLFDDLRPDPRFQGLLKRIGLSGAAQQSSAVTPRR
jgi:TolB-like protein/DNA-binding winged helix-turn-helix (wHTH) protein/Flp pilus assembly protein TadD